MGEELYGADNIEISATLNNLGLVSAYSGEFRLGKNRIFKQLRYYIQCIVYTWRESKRNGNYSAPSDKLSPGLRRIQLFSLSIGKIALGPPFPTSR